MKKTTFITGIIGGHVLCLVLQIYKQSLFVQESYRTQRINNQRHQLTQRHKQLTQELSALKNPTALHHFARTTLGLQPITLKQIKTGKMGTHEKPV